MYKTELVEGYRVTVDINKGKYSKKVQDEIISRIRKCCEKEINPYPSSLH